MARGWPKGKKRRPRTELPEDLDAHGLVARARSFLEDLGLRNYSARTVETRKESLAFFILWCHERELRRPEDIDRPRLELFRRWLALTYRKRNGEPLSCYAQAGHLTALRLFFKWLARKNLLGYNPACELELPKLPSHLPRHVLTLEEVETILSVPEITTVLGLRDRAILEVFYSTGMRRKELCALELEDVHRERRLIHIREGKGNKERYVPVGARALAWLDKYLEEARPELVSGARERAIFVTEKTGQRFKGDNMGRVVRSIIEESGIGKSASCHIFRHTMATLMLENGAEIRYLQELLGHERLTTTQIYTKVTLSKLREIHETTHPAEQPRLRKAALAGNEERADLLEQLTTEDQEDGNAV